MINEQEQTNAGEKHPAGVYNGIKMSRKGTRITEDDKNSQKIVVRAQGISKSFSKKKVLDGVTFSLREGGIYGLVGRNGAGKSTIMNILSGVLPADEGNVIREVVPEKIGCMPERPVLYRDMSAAENMEIVRRMYGIRDKNRANELLSRVGLADVGKKRVRQYSLGMKMRLGLAKVMMNEPEFLMLDEPLNGLDPIGTEKILDILKKMSTGKKTTILISSHMLSELFQIATDWLILEDGKIKAVITEADRGEMKYDNEMLRAKIMEHLRDSM